MVAVRGDRNRRQVFFDRVDLDILELHALVQLNVAPSDALLQRIDVPAPEADALKMNRSFIDFVRNFLDGFQDTHQRRSEKLKNFKIPQNRKDLPRAALARDRLLNLEERRRSFESRHKSKKFQNSRETECCLTDKRRLAGTQRIDGDELVED